ncbi:MAG TPA: sarcosine oxidase subunit beta family protein [Bauldia sp.]|nr:sarcosine oxidase subunit beta family protein [Bauldia sp.]
MSYVHYSALSLIRHGLSGQRYWPRLWRDAQPKASYDVLIVGGGGHGLATAYYLAAEHGLRNIAVIEKGWLGGGNVARNTAIVRSNYLLPESSSLYDRALRLWESMAHDLNYNVMFSQRGVVTLAHTEHDLLKVRQRVEANRANGVESEFLDLPALKRFVPILNTDRNVRFPILGASLQRTAGIARHDAVTWGYARALQRLGVDIIQNCEVNGFDVERGRIKGVRTTRGAILAQKVCLSVSGHSSILAAMAGFRLPITTRVLQAFVSEPVKPLLDTVVMSSTLHIYVSQSDKGEMVFGLAPDRYPGYGPTGSFHILEQSMRNVCAYFPMLRRLRMMRQWSGIIDASADGSPILGKTPVDGLYINTGWGSGGFKATPAAGWVMAHTIARDEPHALNAPFSLDRFRTGHLMDELGAGAVAH